MLTATAVAGLGSVSAMVAAAAVLALMVGVILLLLGLLRVGFLVNFLSHPVLSGFTTAAAIVIAISQLKHLTGLDVPRGLPVHETVVAIVGGLDHANMAALVLGLGSIALLLFFKSRLARLLLRLGMPGFWAGLIAKTGPLAVVLVSTIAVVATGLDDGQRLRIVGDIPRGLPSLTLPVFDPDLWRSLAPAAILIALIAFMESVSVAKALAARNREKIYPNQELVALGVANLGAGVTGAYPVAGGFGRSVVNFAAGARTPLASLITAGLVALAVLFLSPLFHSIPNTALAAIIIVAVSNLIDIPTIRETLALQQGRRGVAGGNLCRCAGHRYRKGDHDRCGGVAGTIPVADQSAAHGSGRARGHDRAFPQRLAPQGCHTPTCGGCPCR